MARGRMISKSLSYSEKFAAVGTTAADLAEFAQLLYMLLVVHADDFGRLQGEPGTVKAICLPMTLRPTPAFTVALEHLHRVGLIAWYVVDHKRFIQIADFSLHQRGLRRQIPSIFPESPEKVSQIYAHFPLKRRELKRTEGKRRSTRAARGVDLNDPAPSTGSVPREDPARRAPDGRAARAASAPLPPEKLALLKKYGFD